MSEIVFDVVILAASIAVLVRSAIFAIERIVKFSKITGIGELAAGFVIVAVATSTPEISVAVFSTHSDNIGITLGDIFGSNVTNIGLVAGLFLLMSPIRKIEHKTLKSLLPLVTTGIFHNPSGVVGVSTGKQVCRHCTFGSVWLFSVLYIQIPSKRTQSWP